MLAIRIGLLKAFRSEDSGSGTALAVHFGSISGLVIVSGKLGLSN